MKVGKVVGEWWKRKEVGVRRPGFYTVHGYSVALQHIT